MRPKGFGKRYFTLNAILAHAVAPKLHSQTTRESAHLALLFDESAADENDPPDEELSALSCLFNDKPCHCNCYFNRLTRLTFLYLKQLCTRSCNCRFYSYRRTGTHPPSLLYPF